MKKLIFPVVFAVLCVTALPVGRALLHPNDALVADGGGPYPICGPVPCRIYSSASVILADGGGPYPICGSKPCTPAPPTANPPRSTPTRSRIEMS